MLRINARSSRTVSYHMKALSMFYLLICDRDLGRARLHAEEWMRITATIPHVCSWINACATSCIVNVGGKGHGLKATPLEGLLAK